MLYMKMFSRFHSFRKRNLHLTVYKLKINIDICCTNELHINTKLCISSLKRNNFTYKNYRTVEKSFVYSIFICRFTEEEKQLVKK